MTELERIKQELRGLLSHLLPYSDPVVGEYIRRILTLDGIEIRADDQSLPDTLSPTYELEGSKIVAQRNMLTPDSEGKVWVKVIPKER